MCEEPTQPGAGASDPVERLLESAQLIRRMLVVSIVQLEVAGNRLSDDIEAVLEARVVGASESELAELFPPRDDRAAREGLVDGAHVMPSAPRSAGRKPQSGEPTEVVRIEAT